MSRRILAMAAVAVTVVAGAFVALGGGGPAASDITYRTATAALADVEQIAAATGTLDAATRYDLAFGQDPVEAAQSVAAPAAGAGTAATAAGAGTAQARATVTWPVTEVRVRLGEVVKAGDVLAVADHASAAFAVEIAKQNLAGARQDLRDAEAGGIAAARASAKGQVTEATAQLRQARTSRTDTANQNAQAVRAAQRVLTDARKALNRDRAAGAVAAVLQADKAAIAQAERSLSSTRLQATAANHQASAQVKNAELSLAAAKRGYRTATAKPTASALASRQVAVDDAETALRDAESALDAAVISAPVDGRVTAIYVVPGAESTGTAITLASLELEVRVAVDESDIARVAVGQTATVSITPVRAQVGGTVRSIDPTAIIGANAVTRYTVIVALEGATASTTGAGSVPAPADLLPGMTAEITMVTDRASGVLAIPAAALSGTAGAYTVRVLSGTGVVEVRQVQVGLVTAEVVEVTSGLAAGDAVVTGTSADLVDTGNAGGFAPPEGGSQSGLGGQQP